MSKYSDKAFVISDLIKVARKKQGKLQKAYDEYLIWKELIDELSILHNKLMGDHREECERQRHESTIIQHGHKEDNR